MCRHTLHTNRVEWEIRLTDLGTGYRKDERKEVCMHRQRERESTRKAIEWKKEYSDVSERGKEKVKITDDQKNWRAATQIQVNEQNGNRTR